MQIIIKLFVVATLLWTSDILRNNGCGKNLARGTKMDKAGTGIVQYCFIKS